MNKLCHFLPLLLVACHPHQQIEAGAGKPDTEPVVSLVDENLTKLDPNETFDGESYSWCTLYQKKIIHGYEQKKTGVYTPVTKTEYECVERHY